MDKTDYQNAVEQLQIIQKIHGTTVNNEAIEDTFLQREKMMLSLGNRTVEDVERSEKHYRQELLKYPLLTEHENVLCNWILNDMLNILYETRNNIKSGENDPSLNFEMPVIGSVDFGYYDARAMNENGAKVVLISRSLLTSTVFLASIVAQSSMNQSRGLSNDYINQYFIDMAIAFHFKYDIASVAKRCPIIDWTACMMGETLSATSNLFIVAHEYSHLILNHPQGYYERNSPKKPYIYEKEADELAGLLCGIVISANKESKHAFSFPGLAFAVCALDLFNDILSVLNENKWDPDINTHPLNRTSVAPDVMQRFKYYDKKGVEIIAFMLGDMHRLWEDNKDKIKIFITKHHEGLSYEEMQKQIYG